MDPSPAVIARWVSDENPGTVGDVCEWAGVRGALKQALLADLDAEETDHFRGLAAMPEETVKDTIDELLVQTETGGVAVSKMQAAKLSILFRAARVAAGVQPTTAEEKAKASQPAHAAVDAVGTARGSSAAAAGPDDVAMNGVIVQSGTAVAKKLTPQEIKDAYARFRGAGRKNPKPQADPTEDQMACFRTQLFTMHSCFADFAVLVPFGDRMAKRLKVMGRTIGPDGIITPLELLGPPTIKVWKKSYAVWTTLCRMWDVMCIDTLLDYNELIDEFVLTYGDECWALIYQVDVRTRQELAVRLRREGEDAKALATKNGQVHDFDENRPWEWVYTQFTNGACGEWWRKEIIDKCQLIRAGAARVADYVEEDAPIATPPAPPTPPRTAIAAGQRGPKRQLAIEDGSNEWPMPPAAPAITPGNLLLNKKGHQVCEGFQRGVCIGTDGKSRCLRDGVSLHVCYKCGDNRHGSHYPKECQGRQPEGGKIARRRRK